MKPIYFTLLLGLCLPPLTAQITPVDAPGYDPATDEVYRVRPLLEGGTALLGLGLTTYQFQVINDKDPILMTNGLDRNDIPGYDRWALPDNTDDKDRALAASDAVFFPSIALPFALFTSKKIRKDWLDITVLYTQAQAANGLLYAVSPLGPNFIDRNRPVAYYPEEVGNEIVGGDQNSFFSGHVSTVSTATFFTAKVLSDYNPDWTGRQKALVYGLASLPPAYVAVERVRGLKHFPSDVAVGFGVGAAIGVLVPHVHKRWQRNHRSSLSLNGGYGAGAGVAGLQLRF